MKITVTEDDIKKIRSNLIGLTKFGGDLKKILDAEMETLEACDYYVFVIIFLNFSWTNPSIMQMCSRLREC